MMMLLQKEKEIDNSIGRVNDLNDSQHTPYENIT
jgi:hypothetical protein